MTARHTQQHLSGNSRSGSFFINEKGRCHGQNENCYRDNVAGVCRRAVCRSSKRVLGRRWGICSPVGVEVVSLRSNLNALINQRRYYEELLQMDATLRGGRARSYFRPAKPRCFPRWNFSFSSSSYDRVLYAPNAFHHEVRHVGK